ncbi:MAG: aminotransferase class III-fold pyridoxal phosphate-dependent enzyme, partial [Bdellovibrionales bacterium]|nr:aminotransferase class III-fold pyridoxal phosphate-dependent enzyme [Bdellovibrionales bacterium]
MISRSQVIEGPKPPQSELTTDFNFTIEKINALRGRPLFYPYVGSGLGRGPYVELEDGSVKLDLINGIGIHLMGHSHPVVIESCLEGSLSDVVMQGHLEANREYLNLSQKLVELASPKSKLRHAWLTTCGTMANENALKMARQKTSPARMIITMENAFAGRSTMMAEVTDNPSFKQGLPEYHEVLRIPYPEKGMGADKKGKSLAKFKEHLAQHKNNICCFVFEPMLGEGGYKVPDREELIEILKVCKDHKIPIWADEVQTFCRTGEFFAFETLGFGEYVDIVTIAKTAQSGATLYTEELNPQPGLIAGTFASSSVSLRSGFRILEHL